MKNSLFFAELKRILKSSKVFIPILGILFIPLLYSGILLWGFWDPYSQLNQLPVAVVNEDSGAEFEGEDLKIGNELMEELKKNDDFDFKIVSKDEAYRGLENRQYYMVIEVPKDFSKNATTLMDEHPEKLQLKYVLNKSHNFVSGQISETAVKEIRTSVQKSITETYAETMFDQIHEIGEGLDTASNGAEELHDGAAKLTDGANQVKENLAVLANKSLEFSEGVNEAGNGSKELATGAEQLDNGLAQLEQGQSRLISGGKDIQDGTNSLAGGIAKTQEGLNRIDSKMDELAAGMDAAKTGIDHFAAEAPALEEGAASVAQGAGQLNEGLADFEKQLVNQLNGAMDQQMKQLLPVLEQSMTPEQLEAFKQQMAEQNRQMLQGVEAGFEQVQNGSAELAAGSEELHTAMKQVGPNVTELSEGLAQLQSGQLQLKEGIHQLAQGSGELSVGVSKLQAGEKELISGMGLLGEKLNEAKAGSSKLSEGAKELTAGMNELSNGSEKISEGTDQLAEGSKQLAEGSEELKAGTKEMEGKLGEAAAKAGSVNSDEDNYDMMADPVQVKKEEKHEVPNYGTGIAPYFLSLGLYVGALLLTVVFPLREPSARPKSGFSWFIGKYGILLIVGIVQALLAVSFLLFFLEIEVESVPLFIATSIITSLTFMA
ncbi:MAG TPA: YhgE/Pip domain-containing protein, partial [Chondromyces sp.]|nr:YhgE/Pip domain-containing protein [Chondromyces sp.]